MTLGAAVAASELVALGGALLAAGLFARAGARFGLPTIPLFMIAGIVLGPNTPGVSLVDDPQDLALLGTLGLILLLFHLGIEFSLRDLVAGGKRLLWIGAMYLVLNVGGGLIFGFVLGWGSREALVIAGAMGISSSAIVTKLLVELKRLGNPETRLILGIIVVEDIFLALYLALLEPVLGDAQGFGDAVRQFTVAFAFLLALACVARWGARYVAKLIGSSSDELLTIAFVGLAILVAGVAEELGVSDAIGAFMVGLILAETVLADRIEKLVLPVRDVFAALFFFAFGLTIDPGDVGTVALPVSLAVVVTVVLNAVAGVIAARSSNYGRRQAAAIGLTILGRGEFSLILATLAAEAGLDERIGPFVALYVLVLAIGAPIAAANSRRLSELLPARMFCARPAPS
jgi:monovalent cation:H+ antiporter-2, CPA2 family